MTKLHSSTFEYLKPTEDQLALMDSGRMAVKAYADKLEVILDDGPDKTYILRKLRELAMWVNVSITRGPDGAPRE